MNRLRMDKSCSSILKPYLFVGGVISGKVMNILPGIDTVNVNDGGKHIQIYKRVQLIYGNKLLKVLTYDVFTPNGEQTPELKAEFERQLPHLLEQL